MSFKYNTKQRSKSIQGLRSFKDTLPNEAKRIIKKKGEIYSKTLENWKYIVGKDLFDVSYPKSFKKSNKVGQSNLIIMVKRGNEVNLEYSKKDIIKKMNAYFGYSVVENIKLRTFDVEINKNKKEVLDATKRNHSKKISSIKNEKIMKSLLELNKVFKER
tara:strand:- start:45 stop:524 length:480 start_codon:yes stop_codon:yes gene_type:complete